MSIVNDRYQYLLANERANLHFQLVPQMVCADGFEMSVQAGRTHYCDPRYDGEREYDSFEVGYPSEQDDLLTPYAEDRRRLTETVYGYVPADVIDAVIVKHGGLA